MAPFPKGVTVFWKKQVTSSVRASFPFSTRICLTVEV